MRATNLVNPCRKGSYFQALTGITSPELQGEGAWPECVFGSLTDYEWPSVIVCMTRLVLDFVNSPVRILHMESTMWHS